MEIPYLKVNIASARKIFSKIMEDLGTMPWEHMLNNVFFRQAANFCTRRQVWNLFYNLWKSWRSNFLENLSRIKLI